jgi:hypothetical protein
LCLVSGEGTLEQEVLKEAKERENRKNTFERKINAFVGNERTLGYGKRERTSPGR